MDTPPDRPANGAPPGGGAAGRSSATLPAPVAWVRSVSELRLPASTDRRLTALMDRNTEGTLTPADREELVALIDVSESLALVRADAYGLLGAAPR